MDVFKEEESLRAELDKARRQLEDVTAQIDAAQSEYRRAAAESLDGNSDDAALKLKRQVEKLEVRRDGLAQRIFDLEPRWQNAQAAAMAENQARAERERRERYERLRKRGNEAAQKVIEAHENFMRAISEFDDARNELANTEFTPLGGGHECEALNNMITNPEGKAGLQGRLAAKGWQPRRDGWKFYTELWSLIPPK